MLDNKPERVLQLHHTREQELGLYSDMVAAQSEVYVQSWLRVGEAPVEVSLDEKGQEEMIPAVLKWKKDPIMGVIPPCRARSPSRRPPRAETAGLGHG
jgi:hypothetical protein